MRALIVDIPSARLSAESRDMLHSIGWETTCVDGFAAALDIVKTRQPRRTGDGAESFDAMLVSAPPDEEWEENVETSKRQKAKTGGSSLFTNDSSLVTRKQAWPVEPASGRRHPASRRRQFDELIDLAEELRLPALVLTDHPDVARPNGTSLVDSIGRSISPAELKGRMEIIERYQPLFRRMDRQVSQMQKLTQRLDRHFREIDQEMRLAGRLQRDFLPKLSEPIRNIRFATVYRPALWVSGDTFDVYRVSENVTAVYVADAVGHGMAASLLTMFIRRAIVSKQIQGDGFRLLTPSETVAGLNAALIEQELPDSRFVTACYMLIDHSTLKVTFAHGGHPYPVVLSPDGTLRELEATGALLGIFENAEFPVSEAQLHPGDKLLIYTDGLELAFGEPRHAGACTSAVPACRSSGPIPTTASYLNEFRSLAALPIEELMRQLEARMDQASGSLTPSDDVTIVGFECLRD